MAQWGRNDQAVTATSVTTKETSNGAPIGTGALVKFGGQNTSVRTDGANAHFGNTSTGSRASVDLAMFGNTTQNAFIPGKAVGVFGVDSTEVNVTTGGIATAVVVYGGSGYSGNTTTTLTVTNGGSSGVVNAFANVTAGSVNAGRITALKISTAGSGYVTAPTVAITAPTAINITANSSGFSNTTDTLVVSTANSFWQVNDRLYYGVPTSNTPIAPLTGNTYYYVSFANTSTIALSATIGGANIDITDVRNGVSGETHTIRGDTATGAVTVGGAFGRGVAHAGWVLRTEGSGGRAGRVQFETLVAMGSLGSTDAKYGTAASTADASDDTILPDA